MTLANSPLAPEGPADADDRLAAAAAARLRSSGHRPLWYLRCEVRDGVVVLSGVLPTFYLKQMAQTVLLRLAEVRGVKNLVEVGTWPAAAGDHGSRPKEE
jgi:hypothetical protein